MEGDGRRQRDTEENLLYGMTLKTDKYLNKKKKKIYGKLEFYNNTTF